MTDSYYGSTDWRRLRKIIKARDPVCVAPGCKRATAHVDHIVPRSQGGKDTPENLRGLCHSCHNSRSARGNGPLRAIGCGADGTPNDPAHPWLSWGQSEREVITPSKDQPLGPSHRAGERASTKFGGR